MPKVEVCRCRIPRETNLIPMKISYIITKNKLGKHTWERQHGNGKKHSSGQSVGNFRLQGNIRAVIGDFTRRNSTAREERQMAADLRKAGKFILFDGARTAEVHLR